MRYLRRLISYWIMRWRSLFVPLTVGAWVKRKGNNHWEYMCYHRRFCRRKWVIGDDKGFKGEIQHISYWHCHLSSMQIRALTKGVDPRMIQEDKLVAYFPLVGTTELDKVEGGDYFVN